MRRRDGSDFRKLLVNVCADTFTSGLLERVQNYCKQRRSEEEGKKSREKDGCTHGSPLQSSNQNSK